MEQPIDRPVLRHAEVVGQDFIRTIDEQRTSHQRRIDWSLNLDEVVAASYVERIDRLHQSERRDCLRRIIAKENWRFNRLDVVYGTIGFRALEVLSRLPNPRHLFP